MAYNKIKGGRYDEYDDDENSNIWDDTVIEEDEFDNINQEFLDVHINGDEYDLEEEDRKTTKHTATVTDNNIRQLVVALMAAGTTGGTTYAFGLYASALKEALELHESELDTISATFFCAGLASWIPGMAVDAFGPKFCFVSGGSLGCIFLLVYWCVAMQFIYVDRSFVVLVLSFLGIGTYMSCAMVTGSVFKLIVSTCTSNSKGKAVGAAKGYVGLGSGAYTCMFEYLSLESELDFLPLAAVFAVMVVSVPALLLLPNSTTTTTNVINVVDGTTKWHFKIVYCGLLVLGAVVVGSSISQLFGGSQDANYGMAVAVAAAWFVPIISLLCLPIAPTSTDTTDNDDDQIELIPTSKAQNNQNNGHVPIPQHDSDEFVIEDEEEEEDVIDVVQIKPVDQKSDYTLLEMLGTIPAWCLLWTCTLLAGGGTIMTNHVGQMAESLEFPELVAPSCLALFSAAQAASRVVTGSINVVPRPYVLVLACIWCGVAHGIMAVVTSEFWFVMAVVLSGAAFGMIWPLMVLIVGDCFGTKHVGANYMFYDGVTSAIGTLLLSKLVAQHVYESHTNSLECIGQECFQTTHAIISILSLTCILSSILLIHQTQHIYEKR